jgi:hypothetical protein
MGAVPLHVPGSADTVCPCTAGPEIVGSEVLFGATGAARTTAVAAELALLEPAEFEATTATRIVEPTSATARR